MTQSLDFIKREEEPIQKEPGNRNLYPDMRFLHDEKKILIKGSEWILIESLPHRLMIIQVFADPEMQKILSLLSEKSMTIPELRHEIKMPITSGYRKINYLIQKGFVVSTGNLSLNNNKVRKYSGILEDIMIFIDKNKIIVQVKLRT